MRLVQDGEIAVGRRRDTRHLAVGDEDGVAMLVVAGDDAAGVGEEGLFGHCGASDGDD